MTQLAFTWSKLTIETIEQGVSKATHQSKAIGVFLMSYW